jgi:hypothetical protein
MVFPEIADDTLARITCPIIDRRKRRHEDRWKDLHGGSEPVDSGPLTFSSQDLHVL